MSKAENQTDPEVLKAFDTMIAAVKGVERKGTTMPYCSINGNMYAMISKADIIGIRLNDNDLKAFLLVGGRPFEGVPGFVSKEYGAVPAAMMADAKLMQTWFRLSFGRKGPRFHAQVLAENAVAAERILGRIRAEGQLSVLDFERSARFEGVRSRGGGEAQTTSGRWSRCKPRCSPAPWS